MRFFKDLGRWGFFDKNPKPETLKKENIDKALKLWNTLSRSERTKQHKQRFIFRLAWRLQRGHN
jgi:hypothetical protein